MAEKRPALGRGLSALIPDAPATPMVSAERAFDVDLDLLQPNKFQPRTQMDDGRIEDLAKSIRAHGIIQPIVVRRAGDRYEIIAGERRWRASQRAGLLKVPVVVRELADDGLLAAALIENIQREDLNPMEEAHAYRRLVDDFHLTQEQVAESVGKDRSSIANFLRLLKLPAEVRESLAGGGLSMGHARALAGVSDQALLLRLARDVIAKQLSVRDTEALIKKATVAPTEKVASEKDVHTRAAEDRLRFVLGTRVRIARRGKGGRIEIDFASEDELHRLFEALTDTHQS